MRALLLLGLIAAVAVAVNSNPFNNPLRRKRAYLDDFEDLLPNGKEGIRQAFSEIKTNVDMSLEPEPLTKAILAYIQKAHPGQTGRTSPFGFFESITEKDSVCSLEFVAQCQNVLTQFGDSEVFGPFLSWFLHYSLPKLEECADEIPLAALSKVEILERMLKAGIGPKGTANSAELAASLKYLHWTLERTFSQLNTREMVKAVLGSKRGDKLDESTLNEMRKKITIACRAQRSDNNRRLSAIMNLVDMRGASHEDYSGDANLMNELNRFCMAWESGNLSSTLLSLMRRAI